MIFVVGWRPGCPSSLDVTQRVMPRLDGLLVAIQVPVEVVPTLHVVTSVVPGARPAGVVGAEMGAIRAAHDVTTAATVEPVAATRAAAAVEQVAPVIGASALAAAA